MYIQGVSEKGREGERREWVKGGREEEEGVYSTVTYR